MYVISLDNITILHASDSGFEPALEDYRGKIDIALLPTGGASPTASPSQAFKMAEAVHAKVVIPMHGTSSDDDELAALLAGLPDINYVEVKAMSPQKISVP
jgi:L-ascorbate metabolism protein UlaG (beta-lactamase superfamily)